MEKAPGGIPLTAPELIARRFSDDPRNGFLLLDRYERSMQRALVRLLKIYREAYGPDPYRPDEISPEEFMQQTNPFNSTEKRRQHLKNALFPANDTTNFGRTNPLIPLPNNPPPAPPIHSSTASALTGGTNAEKPSNSASEGTSGTISTPLCKFIHNS
jgi:hypothetical protein